MIFDLTRLVLAWFTLVEPHMPWPRETSQKSNDVSILGRISYTGELRVAYRDIHGYICE